MSSSTSSDNQRPEILPGSDTTSESSQPILSAVPAPSNAVDQIHKSLAKVLADPLLSDLPSNPSLEEIETLIALETGDAVKIRVERGGLGSWGNVLLSEIPVRKTAKLRDLKLLIQAKFESIQHDSQELKRKKISWFVQQIYQLCESSL
ncbi:hypothetical protein BKA69DRAFT_1123389 [Paraphysoderma sedebokerense]|nr:hypothetical protein BKA69DRAFT_1123389 [Paraphysoderma sedebokerense]